MTVYGETIKNWGRWALKIKHKLGQRDARKESE